MNHQWNRHPGPYKILVGAPNAWNGRPKVVPWPISFEKIIPKRQINHHYFWVWVRKVFVFYPIHASLLARQGGGRYLRVNMMNDLDLVSKYMVGNPNTWWGAQIHAGLASQPARWRKQANMWWPGQLASQLWWGGQGVAGAGIFASPIWPAGQATMYLGSPPCVWVPHHVFWNQIHIIHHILF